MKIITLFLASSSAAFVPRLQTERISTGLFETALIVQNKGGGHGELGFHLAKLLDAHPKIENVTIVQDDDADYLKEPFKSYPKDLPNVLVNSVPMSTDWIDATFMQNMLGGERAKYDYVFDNCSKSPTGAHKALVDCAAEWGICKLNRLLRINSINMSLRKVCRWYLFVLSIFMDRSRTNMTTLITTLIIW